MNDIQHVIKEKEKHGKNTINILPQPKNFLNTTGWLLEKFIMMKPLFLAIENFFTKNGFFLSALQYLRTLSTKPYIAMPLFILTLSTLTPVLLFAFFAFITSAITFAGFLITEGAILSVGGIILGTFLVSIFGIALLVCTALSVIFFSLQKIGLIR